MKYFRQIWSDVSQGENIDLYFAVPLAIGLALLNIFGVVPPQVVEPITLLVLGTIAISLLVNRNAVTKLSRVINKQADDVLRREFPPDYDHNIERAKGILLIGVTLTESAKLCCFWCQS